MNSLDRFRNTFEFRKTDKLPVHTFGAWNETYERWKGEGLPVNWLQSNYFGEDQCGGTGVHLGTNGFSPFFPRFEKKLIMEDENYEIFYDEHGRIVKKKKNQVNISIAEYLEFPVKTREDWVRIKKRMDPYEETRYNNLKKTSEFHGGIKNRDYPILQPISGTYRILWHLMGDIGLCYAFYDDPEMVHDIMRQWLYMNITAIDRIMKYIDFNILTIMEDLSCNTGMMLSPALFREFMMPYYKELIQHIRKYPSIIGVWVDSDGDVMELIPLLLECGVNGLFPFEVQAGMDVVRIREMYGEKLVIRGGIDKREIAKGKDNIERELDRVLPVFTRTGGYFICLDHQAPPDISLENYMYFLEKAKSYG